VAEELRSEGWIVKGTGDAHGAIDLIALKKHHSPKLIQVKGNRDGGPFANFRPTERAILVIEAQKAGGEPLLAWSPPDRQPTRWYGLDDWPTRSLGKVKRRA